MSFTGPCHWENTRFTEHNVGGFITNIKTWEECSTHCSTESSCFAWTYVTNKHPNEAYHERCHLKDNTFMEEVESQQGETSGLLDCGITQHGTGKWKM